MPQMAPISWLMLMITFFTTMIMFNSMNYFSFIKQPSKTYKKMLVTKSFNWKW
nr:ATP synthase F0 subunit 8 [Clephydroneura sp.]